MKWPFARPATPPAPAAPIWEGVYRQFREVPSRGPACDDDQWMSGYAESLRMLREAYASGGRIAPSGYGEHHLLAQLAALAGRGRERLRIVDFGGALGSAFLHLIHQAPRLPDLRYLVVETEKMCAAGRNWWGPETRLQFATRVPAPPETADLVYVNSALQYIEDYAALLRSLCALQPSHILLARLGAGSIESFVTAQVNVPGSVIPCWFLNAEEVRALLREAGYELLFENATPWSYNVSNLPAPCRIPGTLNMLFGRAGDP